MAIDLILVAIGYVVGVGASVTARWVARRRRPSRPIFPLPAALGAARQSSKDVPPRAHPGMPRAADLTAEKFEVARRILERRHAGDRHRPTGGLS